MALHQPCQLQCGTHPELGHAELLLLLYRAVTAASDSRYLLGAQSTADIGQYRKLGRTQGGTVRQGRDYSAKIRWFKLPAAYLYDGFDVFFIMRLPCRRTVSALMDSSSAICL